MPDWLEDLALESIAPPPNWLPSRSDQLADARLTLRRRFGLMKETPARPSHHLRDFGGAHPFFGGSRIVSGDEIEADLETEITTVNPPIAQGWMVGLAAVSKWIGWRSSRAFDDGSPRALSRSLLRLGCTRSLAVRGSGSG